jgi:hypothetical protein
MYSTQSNSFHASPPQYRFRPGLDSSDLTQVYPIGQSFLELDSSSQIVSMLHEPTIYEMAFPFFFFLSGAGCICFRDILFSLLSLGPIDGHLILALLFDSILDSRSRLRCIQLGQYNSTGPFYFWAHTIFTRPIPVNP